nr:hypothetical protein [uncultured Rhodopila sp.]
MPISSHKFVRGLLNEQVTIRETIASLRTGTLGRSLTLPQRDAAINDRLEVEAEVSALIVEFSRYGNFPILCPHTDPCAAPVIRIRFPSGDYRAEAAGRLTNAYQDRADLYGHDAGEPHAHDSAMPGRGRRVTSGLPPRRRKPGERRIAQAMVHGRSCRGDDGP